MTELVYVVAWWFALQLFGLAALPATLRIFRNLPDAGWAFARPAGLLAVGFLFWQGATFGFLGTDWASILGALLIVGIGAWVLCWREAVGLAAFIRQHRSQVVATEILFTIAFLLWTLVRAYNPEITATEKPMEIAFLDGVLRSDHFPPLDPWLSGYAISYYYFGYVIAGMIARFAAVPAADAFNLMLPTLFALTATGAYAIGSNLYAGSRGAAAVPRRIIGNGLWTVVLVLLLANLEPVLETLNAHQALSEPARQFFQIKDMPPGYDSRSLFPTDPPDSWWWFRATRVVGTPALPGAPPGSKAPDYTINEFPFFSFLLGDMHPHVLALPFAFVAIGFALNVLRAPGALSLASLRRDLWTVGPLVVLFGGLGFLNAWDMPTFLFLAALAFGAQRLLTTGALNRAVVRDVVYGLSGAVVLSVLVYLPFYLGFHSQASGIAPVITHTQIQHFFLFWGPIYLVLATFLAVQMRATWRSTPAGDWTRSMTTWGATLAFAIVAALLRAPVVGLTLPFVVAALALVSRHTLAPAVPVAASAAVGVEHPSARRREPVEIAGAAVPLAAPREQLFALLLCFTGLLLIVGCELVYIRDLFGDRMNTVFKLYYQAWILLALAASYAIPALGAGLARLGGAVRVVGGAWATLLAIVFAAALIYPYAATMSKTHGFSGEATLDGLAFWGRIRPDDWAGIQWLQQNVVGAPVVVEASGGSYQQQFGRVSSMTGLSTLLGWAFHEQQWRGTFDEQGRRKPDIDQIYTSNDPKLVQSLLDKYNVTYVYVGPTERETYGREGANLDRFSQFMEVAFKQGSVTIYRVRGRTA